MKKYLFDHEEGEFDDEIYLKEKNVTLEEGMTSIGDECFERCYNLSSITIPSSVSSIGNGCFSLCTNLSTINIPSSVSSIEDGCFCLCTNLSTITIPSSVSYIGGGCFYDCSKLKGHICIDPNNPTFRTDGKYIYRKDNGKKVDVWLY